MSTKRTTKQTKKRAASKATEAIPPGYRVVEIATGPNPDALAQQTAVAHTLPDQAASPEG